MLHVDDKPETLHIYVVREEAPKPQFFPIFLSVLALASLVALSGLSSYQQPVTRDEIRVPAVLLPIRTFTATVAVIPTGVKVYPATTAHGVLTITNGSVIAQILPTGFTSVSNNGISVVTDRAVFVPAGNANGYGFATVAAHAQISGKAGNIPAYAINQVEGTSVFIRNFAAFRGGRDRYSVTVVIPQDRQTAIDKARSIVSARIQGLHYPCNEFYVSDQKHTIATWRCQFVTHHLPALYHVTGVKIVGKNLIISAWFVARPRLWVK